MSLRDLTLKLRDITSRNYGRLKRVIRVVPFALKMTGGWCGLLSRVVTLYRVEGVKGIWCKFRAFVKRVGPGQPRRPLAQVVGACAHNAEAVVGLRVLIVAELKIPQCTKYRVTQKSELLTKLNVPHTILSWEKFAECQDALATHSHVLFYRVPFYPPVQEMIAEARRLKMTILWEVDDLIFDAEVLREAESLRRIDPVVREQVIIGADLYRQCMLACDIGIASTEGLADSMRKAGVPTVYVVENALDTRTLNAARHCLANKDTTPRDTVRIFYGSGTDTHNVDFEEAKDGLLATLREYPNVIFRLVGLLDLPEAFNEFADRIERYNFCDFDTYLSLMAGSDISIAPLEKFVFNDSKSNIKFLEAAAVAVPSLCSPRAAFRQVITNGENGFLCDTTAEWTAAFKVLIESPVKRKEVGEAALQTVTKRYFPDAVAEQQLRPLFTPSLAPLTKKKRILSVNIFYKPQSFGGATVVAEEVNQHLANDHNYDVYVFTSLPANTADQFALRRYEAGEMHLFGMSLSNSASVIEQFDIPPVRKVFTDVVTAIKPDIVHFHCVQGLGVAPIDVCRELKIPFIVSIHDAWWLCARQFMLDNTGKYCNQERIDPSRCAQCIHDVTYHVARRQRLLDCLNSAERVFTPSDFSLQLHQKNGLDPTKLFLNKNGIRKPASSKRIRQQRPVTFGFVGGVSPVKGAQIIKEVFTHLKRDDICLTVVDNTLAIGFSSMVENYFKDIPNLSVVPAYTQDTIEEFFSGIDVLLFPTQCKESFGLTVREAITRNVWVISSDAGGVVEDIIDGVNGSIIPFNDRGSALEKAVLSAIEAIGAFNVGEEVSFAPTGVTYFEDQATELARFFDEISSLKQDREGDALSANDHRPR